MDHNSRDQRGGSRPCVRWGVLLALLALLVACTGKEAASTTTINSPLIRISGSTSMRRALDELAEAYQRQHPRALMEVRDGDSSIGLSELQAGQTDLAAVSWKPDGQGIPAGLAAFPVARDAIAVVVHPSNRVSGLTSLQLRACFRGELLDWAAIGGSGLTGQAGEPVIVSREDGSGTRAAFEALVMGDDHVTLNALVMPSSQAVVDYVAGHRNAIGYTSMGNLTDQVRAIPIEDATPSAANARAGVYDLTRLLYLYAPEPVPPATQDFLDFALSPTGQAIFARHHVALR